MNNTNTNIGRQQIQTYANNKCKHTQTANTRQTTHEDRHNVKGEQVATDAKSHNQMGGNNIYRGK